MRELEFIEWIYSQGRFDPAVVPVGPGDDLAVVQVGPEGLLAGTDQVLDGVHFILGEHGPRAGGRKAMARNLSDVAAMAALPLAALATVSLPKGLSRHDAQEIYLGMREIGDVFDCPLIGGDMGSWAHPLAISVTILARPRGISPVLRSGAKPGDAICVTGHFGGAWRSPRHLLFTPRIAEARVLAGQFGLHAMIDVSDGLARDLGHVCRASGLGAQVNAAAVPVSAAAGPAGLAAALHDGEDYELLFTLSEEDANTLLDTQPLGVSVSRIGTMTPGEDMVLIDSAGRRKPLRPGGWEHQT
ncbi:MAG: thiamine-phosphate kinase [Planctomycetota bacterium]|nr:thiamine-phosphate kinase [Planctomycetota bacterium]